MKKNYLVRWEIDVEDVESARHAAIQAQQIMRDPTSHATIFDVYPNPHSDDMEICSRCGSPTDRTRVDLMEPDVLPVDRPALVQLIKASRDMLGSGPFGPMQMEEDVRKNLHEALENFGEIEID